MEKAWQDVLDRFPYGIYLVTTVADEGNNGMIASWVTQCSHEPPLVALAIRKNRLSHGQILKTGKFCINVLPKESAGMIGQFKIPDWKKKFDPFPHEPSPNGLPVLDDCIGYVDCSLETTLDAGDHTLFIGKIKAGAMKNTGKTATLSTADYDGVYRGSK
ncbi:MAG: flavin reductase [Deltaproteobacteria bacterium]|nr:flavin reductase [Deltaproteobacteria bacterium]